MPQHGYIVSLLQVSSAVDFCHGSLVVITEPVDAASEAGAEQAREDTCGGLPKHR